MRRKNGIEGKDDREGGRIDTSAKNVISKQGGGLNRRGALCTNEKDGEKKQKIYT
jgi:hypothetical protein